jgi:hypothetical protein
MSRSIWCRVGVVWLSAALSGCNATCLRNSDCLGESVCQENRCLLFVFGDAGSRRNTPPSGASVGAGGVGGSAGTGNSAGASGSATEPREILDAASDAMLPASGT